MAGDDFIDLSFVFLFFLCSTWICFISLDLALIAILPSNLPVRRRLGQWLQVDGTWNSSSSLDYPLVGIIEMSGNLGACLTFYLYPLIYMISEISTPNSLAWTGRNYLPFPLLIWIELRSRPIDWPLDCHDFASQSSFFVLTRLPNILNKA